MELGAGGLLGQVYPHDGDLGRVAGGTVAAQTVSGLTGDAELDEAGGFTLPPPGPVRLRVAVPRRDRAHQLAGAAVLTAIMAVGSAACAPCSTSCSAPRPTILTR